MEFLRFGSSIPGGYWGCCAMCIIQNFKHDPDEKASIQILSGDGGQPIGDNFAGLTYKEIFETRLRIGTFNTSEMPNHGFLAILTERQCTSTLGKKWLKILKDNGFEFIRTVDNSVYSGQTVPPEQPTTDSNNKNYLFGLFRNIGRGAVKDPFAPPKAWAELEGGPKEANDFLTQNQRNEVAKSQNDFNREVWKKGATKFYTRKQVEDAGVTVTLGGQRSKMPQQTADARDEVLKAREKAKATPTKSAPFGGSEALLAVA